jgi:hypothetical protein
MAGVVVDDATLIVTSQGRGPSTKRFRFELRGAWPTPKAKLGEHRPFSASFKTGLERFPRYGSGNSICLRRCSGIFRRRSSPVGPPSLPLLVGSLGRGLGTNSVDGPASAGVEGHVLVGNGLATLRADLPCVDRTPARVASVGSKQLSKETHRSPFRIVRTHHREMWLYLKAPDASSVGTMVLDGVSATAKRLDCDRHPQPSLPNSLGDWIESIRGGHSPASGCCWKPKVAWDGPHVRGRTAQQNRVAPLR